MEVKKTEIASDAVGAKFTLWVFCWDEFGPKDRAYAFKWYGARVIFMAGGFSGEPRVVGQATTQAEALTVAEHWLEGWLRQCGALRR